VYTGRGLSPDILEASAKAYINAINRIIHANNSGKTADRPKADL
ncbi:MAG: hypothetical protein GX878_04190, partial [Firmicutes bacterium]|nr:hypothetical protein [Bacillota bacterium]